jgi:hypothetical protein
MSNKSTELDKNNYRLNRFGFFEEYFSVFRESGLHDDSTMTTAQFFSTANSAIILHKQKKETDEKVNFYSCSSFTFCSVFHGRKWPY